MNGAADLTQWRKAPADQLGLQPAPQWLLDYKEQQWNAFLKNGLPTRKDERWKYTDLSLIANRKFIPAKSVIPEDFYDVINQHRLRLGESILLVSINGFFMPALSDIHKIPKEMIACPLRDAVNQYQNLMEPYWPPQINTAHYPFASLNAAMHSEGIFLYLPDKFELKQPLHLLSLVTTDEESIAHPQHCIVLGKQAKLQLLEEYYSNSGSLYFLNVVTTYVIGKEAQLACYKIQQEGKNAFHAATIFVHQKQDSSASFANLSFGAAFARDDLVIRLEEPGANCHTSGFYNLHTKNQYVDNHIDIQHAAPRTNSEMLYKGIIANKSRAVFNGRLLVEKDAQKIVAYQANHNLLLSDDSEVYSKPELEIYADDVKCKHGASTGQIDPDIIFYLRSRGIQRDEAIQMLLQGFADEILQRITHPGIKNRVQELL